MATLEEFQKDLQKLMDERNTFVPNYNAKEDNNIDLNHDVFLFPIYTFVSADNQTINNINDNKLIIKNSSRIPERLRKNRINKIPVTKMGIFENGRPFKALKNGVINTYLDIYDWFNPEPNNEYKNKEHDYIASIVPNYCPDYKGHYCGLRGCSVYR